MKVIHGELPTLLFHTRHPDRGLLAEPLSEGLGKGIWLSNVLLLGAHGNSEFPQSSELQGDRDPGDHLSCQVLSL